MVSGMSSVLNSFINTRDEEDRFSCQVANCNKTFGRRDHLSRHSLNHERRPRYQCSLCGKHFVRNDVYKRHYRQQHDSSGDIAPHAKITKPLPNNKIKFVYMDGNYNTQHLIKNEKNDDDENNDNDNRIEQKGNSIIEQESNNEINDLVTGIENNYNDALDTTGDSKLPVFSVDELVSSDELIQWLFCGLDSESTGSNLLLTSHNEELDTHCLLEEFEYPIKDDPLSLIIDDLYSNNVNLSRKETSIPNFPYSNDQTSIDSSVMTAIKNELPSIQFQEEFKINRLQYYLENYWKYYHPQFPVLNFPSFSTHDSHPILLLSMLAIGASIASTWITEDPNRAIMFADSIATPLRWTIYESKDFKPPPKLWIVQSLLLLECYEICSSSRDLHERANLHRGLSIQLLKRSPIFGGNPNGVSSDPIDYNATRKQWIDFIEEESMKRCALATFYLETLHAVVFGHDIVIDLHHVKPSLPIDDNFWSTGRYSENCLLSSMTLLAAIKGILHKKSIKAKGFAKKIVISGIIALSFEVQERELEFSIPELKPVKQLWQQKIQEAFKSWDYTSSLSINNKSGWADTYFIPLRQLYESYTHMKHYDFMVYAGAPGRLNVKFGEKEIELVNKKIKDWVDSLQSRRAITFIYWYFCDLLFTGPNKVPVSYDPKQDRCFYRKQIITHMLVVLWCYNFFTCGPESQNFYLCNADPDEIINEEDGHVYLQRIKHAISANAGEDFTSDYLNKNIDIFANALTSVTGRENMVGLLRLFKGNYASDLSEIAREHSRLLDNCINRSLGSKNVFCKNMFE